MITLPSSIKIIDQEDNQATFEVEGLHPGYGITLGNALRRVLLSSLEGTAITSVQIEGAPHEFTTLPGVKEDVVQIVLNFKKLRFRMEETEEQEGRFEVKGVKKVSGQDLILPSQVELINPDQPLATLTSKTAKFAGHFKLGKGIGYESVEQRGEGKAMVGEILIDSIFTPVEKVSFRVEQMRVGKRTDFNRLLLTIVTDGTITPSEALLGAVETLEKHLGVITRDLRPESKTKEKKKTSKTKEEKKNKLGAKEEVDPKRLSVEDLKISQRLKTVLTNNHFKTISGLLTKNREKLLAIKGLSEKGLTEIEKALKKLNLQLKS